MEQTSYAIPIIIFGSYLAYKVSNGNAKAAIFGGIATTVLIGYFGHLIPPPPPQNEITIVPEYTVLNENKNEQNKPNK